jgi:hypothetical protein
MAYIWLCYCSICFRIKNVLEVMSSVQSPQSLSFLHVVLLKSRVHIRSVTMVPPCCLAEGCHSCELLQSGSAERAVCAVILWQKVRVWVCCGLAVRVRGRTLTWLLPSLLQFIVISSFVLHAVCTLCFIPAVPLLSCRSVAKPTVTPLRRPLAV